VRRGALSTAGGHFSHTVTEQVYQLTRVLQQRHPGLALAHSKSASPVHLLRVPCARLRACSHPGKILKK
jgi:hypothetical protein